MSTLNHLPPLPLIVGYSDTSGTRTLAHKYEDNIHLGLQQNGRVRRATLRAPSSSLRILLELMNKPFPRLEDLSLLSTTTEIALVLPEALQAPSMSRLSLQGIGLSKGPSPLSSMIALSTLSLTHIRDSCYFAPGSLVTQLQDLLCLEELSIGFSIPIPLPSSQRELLPTPIPPVTLPALRRLTFRGMSVYLDNLVAQIKTPLMEQLSLTLFFELAFTLVNLAAFIRTTEGLRCLVAQVIFNKERVSIDAGHHGQWVTGKCGLHVNVTCESLDRQIYSATQVCSAIGKVLSTVEELALDLDVNGMALGQENTLNNMLWHELLLPFIGVKKLHIGSSLTLELCRALVSVAGRLVLELLPELQEVDIQPIVGFEAFSGFVKTRESIGRPVDFSYQRESIGWPVGFSYQRGPIVPQKRYKPHTSSDRRRYVEEVNLEPAIFFYRQMPDELGIPLRDALHGRFARLAGRDEPMFKERGPSISVRINVSDSGTALLCHKYLMLYKISGQVINHGVVRSLQGTSVTLLGQSHVRNSPRTWPSRSLASLL
jgi:hypothetical protein